jgi:hypothetical protein
MSGGQVPIQLHKIRALFNDKYRLIILGPSAYPKHNTTANCPEILPASIIHNTQYNSDVSETLHQPLHLSLVISRKTTHNNNLAFRKLPSSSITGISSIAQPYQYKITHRCVAENPRHPSLGSSGQSDASIPNRTGISEEYCLCPYQDGRNV